MAEPWIRVHANLATKPVTLRAAGELRVSQNEAIGLLVRFWGQMSQHGANGSVSTLSDLEIETWSGWRGKRGVFASFLRAAHTDADGRVNEWDDFAGKLEDRRAKDRDRKRKSRGQDADSPRDVTGDSIPTRANDTNTRRYETENRVVEAAIALSVRANQGLAEHPTNPQSIARIIATSGKSHEAAEDILAAGVPLDFAEAQVYQLAKSHGADGDIKSLKYFTAAVIRAWEEFSAEVTANGTPRPKANGQRPGIGGRAYLTTLEALEDMP